MVMSTRTLLNIIYRQNIELTGTLQQVACGNIRFSSLFAAGDVLRGGTSASQRQKFHTDDVNHTIESSKNMENTMGQNNLPFFFILIHILEIPGFMSHSPSSFLFPMKVAGTQGGGGGGIPDFK